MSKRVCFFIMTTCALIGVNACTGGSALFSDDGGDGTQSCGDGQIGGDETCDGADLGGASCSSEGLGEGQLACNATCDGFDTSDCDEGPDPDCGNGVVDVGEVCDGSGLGSSSCEDQGYDGGELACADNCQGFDFSGCYSCGDGEISGGELCDGGALPAGEDCTTQGHPGGGALTCNASCDGFDVSQCAPNHASGPELGIDMNGLPNWDGTTATMACVGVSVSEMTTVSDVRVVIGMDHTWVGDMVIQLVSPANTISTLMHMPGAPGSQYGYASDLALHYRISFSGNASEDAETLGAMLGGGGVICKDDGRCDYLPNPDGEVGMGLSDFNGEETQGTWQVCFGDTFPGADHGFIDYVGVEFNKPDAACGDGVWDLAEACDDGNTTPGDGCSADCKSDESCGNGIRELAEECDDGNNTGGDTCEADCTLICGSGSGAVAASLSPTDNSCFVGFIGTQGYTGAQNNCQSLGGTLASIADQAENDTLAAMVPFTGRMWIGFNDQQNEGMFEWLNGDPVGYTNWGGGEPNDNNGEDCGEIINAAGLWNDANCNAQRGYACEI